MTPLGILRLALAIALLIVVPGVLLVNALFPRTRMSSIERGYLAVASGLLLLMLVGVTLGSLPENFSLFAPLPVAVVMVAASMGLFWVGLQRGAYPRLRRAVTPAGSATRGASQDLAPRRP